MNPFAANFSANAQPSSTPGGELSTASMLTPAGELTAALDLLSRTVEELAALGRHAPTAAGLKSAMQARGPFHESTLGFSSFREFLRAGDAAGRIHLIEPAPGSGLDVTVTLAEAQGDVGTSQAAKPRAPHIRHDLWTAFVDWRTGFERVWATAEGRAYVIRSNPDPDDDPATLTIRRRLQEGADDLVPIRGITLQTQLGWMSDFVAGIEDEAVKAELSYALRQDRPVATFTAALRKHQPYHAKWTQLRQDRVAELVRSWMVEHSLVIDLYARVPPARRGPSISRTAARVGMADARGGALRDQVIAAVERMPLGELLRLPIPAEYLLMS